MSKIPKENRRMNKLIELSALIILLGVAIPIITMAAKENGALVYYYEPNKYLLGLEAVLIGFAIIVGFKMVLDRIVVGV